MLASQTGTGPDAPCRILSPLAALTRLRPVKLFNAGAAIFPHPRRVEALRLFCCYYPALLWDVLPLDDWTDLLRYFLRLVEQERGIEMDWAIMDYLYEWAMNDYPEDEEDEENPDWEPGGLSWLAETLGVVPVRFFGFDREAYFGSQLEDYPAMELLNALLEPGGHKLGGEFDFLNALGDWKDEDKKRALARLDKLEASAQTGPLAWLPEMARYACAETGNDLLDTSPHFEHWSHWYTWGDLDTVCALYAEARTTFEKMEEFNRWAVADTARLKRITTLITGRDL